MVAAEGFYFVEVEGFAAVFICLKVWFYFGGNVAVIIFYKLLIALVNCTDAGTFAVHAVAAVLAGEQVLCEFAAVEVYVGLFFGLAHVIIL